MTVYSKRYTTGDLIMKEADSFSWQSGVLGNIEYQIRKRRVLPKLISIYIYPSWLNHSLHHYSSNLISLTLTSGNLFRLSTFASSTSLNSVLSAFASSTYSSK